MAVIATTIINIGLTIFALTAASPNIKAPTIPIVGLLVKEHEDRPLLLIQKIIP